MKTFPSYMDIHVTLWLVYGMAKEHMCACGNPANEWAYQHTDINALVSKDGFPYSTDLSSYKPMCYSCHRTLDYSINTKAREELIARGLANVSAAGKASWKAKLANPQRLEEHRKRVQQNGRIAARKVNSLRRKCSICGMTGLPMNIGRHQSASGHQGWDNA